MSKTEDLTNKSSPRLLIHMPESWQRLVTVIKHQANSGNFIYIEAPHGAGKTTFAEILLKKLTLIDELETSYQKLHPLINTQQVLNNIQSESDLLSVVILDDAAEVDASVLEELIASNIDYFFVILAEPELLNRVPRLENSRFKLPLFNKEDCHKLLTKMYHLMDSGIEIPALESEIVYYESKGFPGEVIRIGEKLKDKFQRQSSGLNSFEIANKGIFSTAVLVAGLLIFLLYLFWPSSETSNVASQTVDNQNMASSEKNNESVEAETSLPELLIENQEEQNSVETGELLIAETQKPQTFTAWVASQPPEHYTIQLFSNHSQVQAVNFKEELDLADSHVYSASVNNVTVYRVVWGVYPNRARAQLAIQSLPKDILQQKPWLRSFSAIATELKAQP